MPLPIRCRPLTLVLSLLLGAIPASAWSQTVPAPARAESNPLLDGELFYELLVGEMSVRLGDPVTGYALVLEAARRTRSDQLFQRATEMALQGRSGEQALAAARAWKSSLPQSREANRFLLQILVALNRIGDTPELLRQELAGTPARTRSAAILAIPQLYGRASDKAQAAQLAEQALADELTNPAHGPAAWVTLGRMRLAAGERDAALKAAQQSLALDPQSEPALRFTLDLMEEGVEPAEPLLRRHLAQATPELRMAYARVLLGAQRYSEARVQLEQATRDRPDAAEAWLILATLQLQEQQHPSAQASVDRFLALAASAGSTPNTSAEALPRLLNQAYLLQAQLAERRKDFDAAKAWLDRVDNADDQLGVQARRASLLARQGQVAQARALLQRLPGNTPEERRAKLLAEVQLLRDLKQYQEAYDVQAAVVALSPDDGDLLYEQAMLAEKAGRPDRMEALLRQLIERQPKNHHAYNALGYSLADRGVRLAEARELIVKALELAPGDPFITDSLGWVEFRMGRLPQARELLQKAFDTRADAEIAAHLGEVLWAQGERELALAIWRKGLALSPDNDTLQETLRRLGARP